MLQLLKCFIYFIPGLLIKQLLSMYMEDARFKDKEERIRNNSRGEDGDRLVAE